MARKRKFYILDGHTPVRELDISKWAEWYKTANTIVKEDFLPDHGVHVVTIFTGEDLFRDHTPTRPFLFHIYAYGGALEEGYDDRGWSWHTYSWDFAEELHLEMLIAVDQCLEEEKTYYKNSK